MGLKDFGLISHGSLKTLTLFSDAILQQISLFKRSHPKEALKIWVASDSGCTKTHQACLASNTWLKVDKSLNLISF